jgi:hypothetical protein
MEAHGEPSAAWSHASPERAVPDQRDQRGMRKHLRGEEQREAHQHQRHPDEERFLVRAHGCACALKLRSFLCG